MIPIDADLALAEQVRRAAVNAAAFDRKAFAAWLVTRPGEIQEVARLRPPWLLYKVLAAYCVIEGYAPAEGGLPARCVVRLLAADVQMGVTADALEPIPTASIAEIVSKLNKLGSSGGSGG